MSMTYINSRVNTIYDISSLRIKIFDKLFFKSLKLYNKSFHSRYPQIYICKSINIFFLKIIKNNKTNCLKITLYKI